MGTYYAYVMLDDESTTSDIVSVEVTTVDAVKLNTPTCTKAIVVDGGVYRFRYTPSSDQSALEGAPTPVYSYVMNGGEAVTGSSYTPTTGGTLLVTATADGYTSSNALEITVPYGSYYRTYSFDTTSEISVVDTETTDGKQANINATGCKFYNLNNCTYTLRSDMSIGGSGFRFVWAISANKAYSLYTRSGSGSISYSLNDDEIIEFTNNGESVFSTSETTTTNFDQWSVVKQIYIYTPTNYKETATVGANGYATFASAYPLDLTDANRPEGLKAYKATLTGTMLSFTKLNQTVPAGTGLLLLGETKDGTYNIPVVASSDAVESNALVGVTTATALQSTENGIYYFVMKKAASESDPLAFAPLSTSSAVTVPTGKAYVALDTSSGARSLTVCFDDETTGISNVNDNENDNWFFDLQGRKVSKPSHGLYIKDGKKVIVK